MPQTFSDIYKTGGSIEESEILPGSVMCGFDEFKDSLIIKARKDYLRIQDGFFVGKEKFAFPLTRNLLFSKEMFQLSNKAYRLKQPELIRTQVLRNLKRFK